MAAQLHWIPLSKIPTATLGSAILGNTHED